MSKLVSEKITSGSMKSMPQKTSVGSGSRPMKSKIPVPTSAPMHTKKMDGRGKGHSPLGGIPNSVTAPTKVPGKMIAKQKPKMKTK